MIESSRGMPQHWHISWRGEPSNVLMETLKHFDRSFSVSVLGTVSPFSQRDTACLVTNTFSARSSCDKPFFDLRSYIISFVVISIRPPCNLFYYGKIVKARNPLLLSCFLTIQLPGIIFFYNLNDAIGPASAYFLIKHQLIGARSPYLIL